MAPLISALIYAATRFPIVHSRSVAYDYEKIASLTNLYQPVLSIRSDCHILSLRAPSMSTIRTLFLSLIRIFSIQITHFWLFGQAEKNHIKLSFRISSIELNHNLLLTLSSEFGIILRFMTSFYHLVT